MPSHPTYGTDGAFRQYRRSDGNGKLIMRLLQSYLLRSDEK